MRAMDDALRRAAAAGALDVANLRRRPDGDEDKLDRLVQALRTDPSERLRHVAKRLELAALSRDWRLLQRALALMQAEAQALAPLLSPPPDA
jgi:hypothetical protein